MKFNRNSVKSDIARQEELFTLAYKKGWRLQPEPAIINNVFSGELALEENIIEGNNNFCTFKFSDVYFEKEGKLGKHSRFQFGSIIFMLPKLSMKSTELRLLDNILPDHLQGFFSKNINLRLISRPEAITIERTDYKFWTEEEMEKLVEVSAWLTSKMLKVGRKNQQYLKFVN